MKKDNLRSTIENLVPDDMLGLSSLVIGGTKEEVAHLFMQLVEEALPIAKQLVLQKSNSGDYSASDAVSELAFLDLVASRIEDSKGAKQAAQDTDA